MPYGAEPGPEGVRFSLWAPAAAQVRLQRLTTAGHWSAETMQPKHAGWFELTCPDAGPGTVYRFMLEDGTVVADPASRCQAGDVHGPSVVVDAGAFRWQSTDWRGRPWAEAVLYELHVGTFTPTGTYEGVLDRLDELVALGVTGVELMPVADFAGSRNWGYDGVLPFAPDRVYGSPDALRRLIDAAHARGLMMILDVVYNHFGPEGNLLHRYAPDFFTDRFHTPWGEALDFGRREVRDFFIHNALYWLEEFRFDGLRLDAVHAIPDDHSPHVLEELAERVHAWHGGEREVHLILENDANIARWLERDRNGRPRFYTAQWNDDLHHSLHVLATRERDGYYADYADAPAEHLLRCLCEGFAWQGERSAFRDGATRGEPSAHLPPAAFVSFLQNHDQVGNRAFGERLAALTEPEKLRALAAIVLLAPHPPQLFMGEEWAAREPFLYFCDLPEPLATQVREGRRREFAGFRQFTDGASRESIPDPGAAATFEASVLDWEARDRGPHAEHLALYRTLLELRHSWLHPRLTTGPARVTEAIRHGRCALQVSWRLSDGSALALLANPGSEAVNVAPLGEGWTMAYRTHESVDHSPPARLVPWEVSWWLAERRAAP